MARISAPTAIVTCVSRVTRVLMGPPLGSMASEFHQQCLRSECHTCLSQSNMVAQAISTT
jgi:hypothetical protein